MIKSNKEKKKSKAILSYALRRGVFPKESTALISKVPGWAKISWATSKFPRRQASCRISTIFGEDFFVIVFGFSLVKEGELEELKRNWN